MKINTKLRKLEIVNFENYKVGAIVKKGPDWMWGTQGGGSLGIIVKETYKDAHGIFWAKVKWENGEIHSYRVGPKSFDLLYI